LETQKITDILSLHDPGSFTLTFQKQYLFLTFPQPHKFPEFFQFSLTLTCRTLPVAQY